MKISTDHSHNSNEDYQSKSSVDSVSMSCNVRMTILIEFYYPQTSDNVHEWRVWNGKTNLYLVYNEEHEGVKWELGFAFFGGWEMGFWALRLGFMKQKQQKMGMGFQFEQHRLFSNTLKGNNKL